MVDKTPSQHQGSAAIQELPVQILIGLATAPLLAALVGGKLLASTLETVGHWSEELFRGDRLPPLSSSPSDPADA